MKERLLVMQPDGTVREGTDEDWLEHARQQQEHVERMKEIEDIERLIRLRKWDELFGPEVKP